MLEIYSGADPTHSKDVFPELSSNPRSAKRGEKTHPSKEYLSAISSAFTQRVFGVAAVCLLVTADVAAADVRVPIVDLGVAPHHEASSEFAHRSFGAPTDDLESIIQQIRIGKPLAVSEGLRAYATKIAAQPRPTMSDEQIDRWASELARSVAGAND